MSVGLSIRCHEGFPLGLICLQEMFLGPFQDKPQAVEVVQTTAAAQQEPEAFLDKSPRNFPIPIRQVDACLFGQRLDRSPQLGLLVPVEGGGTTRLLEAKGCGTAIGEGSDPRADCVGVPFQCLSYGKCGPALGQEPESMPPFSLPRCRRSIHPFSYVTHIQLPPLKELRYVPHAHHHRQSTSSTGNSPRSYWSCSGCSKQHWRSNLRVQPCSHEVCSSQLFTQNELPTPSSEERQSPRTAAAGKQQLGLLSEEAE